MSQVVVARGQTLRVIPQFMLAQQSNRAGQPDLNAEVYERVLKPFGTLETTVN